MEKQPQSTTVLSITATLLTAGQTATGIEVPESVLKGLGESKKPAVHVKLNGYDYHSTVAVMGGKFMLPVSAEIRKGAGIEAGQTVLVTVSLDARPRELVIPVDVLDALQSNGEADAFFRTLSYSNKHRLIIAIDSAKAAAHGPVELIKSWPIRQFMKSKPINTI